MNKPKITLCMIVKNESHIILECLKSVTPYIDSYSIVDTGSSDNTKEIIKNYFFDMKINGEVHSRPWVNFGKNRTEALDLARNIDNDYILMMDADDILSGQPDFNNLTADAYYINIKLQNLSYLRVQLFSSKKPWIYCGVVHEYPECYETYSLGHIPDTGWIKARCEGNRSKDPDKFKKDIELLKKDLEENPSNTRSMFYLAQSQFDDGQFKEAYESYKKRFYMGGWEEEAFYSIFRMGMCLIHLNEKDSEITDTLIKAWAYRPTRIEPLYYLTKWHREKNNFQIASLFAKPAVEVLQSKQDILFVESDIYDWKIFDELSLVLFYTGYPEESLSVLKSILNKDSIPEYEMIRLLDNKNKIIESMKN